MRSVIIAALMGISTVCSAQSMSDEFVGVPYTLARARLWQAGYRPFLPKDRLTSCEQGDRRCSNYPEMETCSSEGQKVCLTRWHDQVYSRTIYIATAGETPVVMMMRVRDY